MPPPYTVRVLPPEEWSVRWPELGYGTAHQYDPTQAILIVVEDSTTGAIVASWFAVNTVHLEGLQIAETHRHNPSVARLLQVGMMHELHERGVGAVLTVGETPEIVALAQHGGFVIVPGTLLQLRLGE